MERTVHIASTRVGALRWAILQHLRMNSEERQAAAHSLRARAFHPYAVDAREWHASGEGRYAFHVKRVRSQIAVEDPG